MIALTRHIDKVAFKIKEECMDYYKNPGEDDVTKPGGLRLLKPGEIVLAVTLFGYSIHYNKVWVHRGSYLPFNIQGNFTAMTPNGEMWFQEGVYEEDFSRTSIKMQHMFLHEMMHVWQHQRGMWVRTRGAFSWAADYSYSLDKENLLDYSLEQQASLVSDYWVLLHGGFYHTKANINYRHYPSSESVENLIEKYRDILGSFPQ